MNANTITDIAYSFQKGQNESGPISLNFISFNCVLNYLNRFCDFWHNFQVVFLRSFLIDMCHNSRSLQNDLCTGRNKFKRRSVFLLFTDTWQTRQITAFRRICIQLHAPHIIIKRANRKKGRFCIFLSRRNHFFSRFWQGCYNRLRSLMLRAMEVAHGIFSWNWKFIVLLDKSWLFSSVAWHKFCDWGHEIIVFRKTPTMA